MTFNNLNHQIDTTEYSATIPSCRLANSMTALHVSGKLHARHRAHSAGPLHDASCIPSTILHSRPARLCTGYCRDRSEGGAGVYSTLPQGFASSEELDDNSSPERSSIQVNGWRRQQWPPTPYRQRADYSVHQHPTISKRFQRHRLPCIKPIFTISNTGTDTAERSITKTHRTPPAPCKKKKRNAGEQTFSSWLSMSQASFPAAWNRPAGWFLPQSNLLLASSISTTLMNRIEPS
jgi:hypothetical protein